MKFGCLRLIRAEPRYLTVRRSVNGKCSTSRGLTSPGPHTNPDLADASSRGVLRWPL